VEPKNLAKARSGSNRFWRNILFNPVVWDGILFFNYLILNLNFYQVYLRHCIKSAVTQRSSVYVI
ncbi:TPA: hypothetical protein ACT9MX_003104, partial [Legionella pneumophila]